MRLTARQCNRATLERQLLLRREALPVVEAVGRLVGLQAQEAPSPYLALWNRLAGFDPAELDAAFAARDLVKAPLMRLTLHAVRAVDHPVLHAAMTACLRGSRLGDRRFTSTGLSPAELDRIVPDLLAFLSEPRSNADAEALLDGWRAGHGKGLWWAVRTVAPVVRAPTGGPWAFDAARYVAAEVSATEPGPAAAELVLRYLTAFGPATTQDLRQFTMLPAHVLRAALDALGDRVEPRAGAGGARLLDVAGGTVPDADVPAPARLLPMWDSVLLAYADRSRVLPDAYRGTVIRRNGDVLPTVLVDGLVAGLWRPVPEGIEVTAFERLAPSAWAELDAEADRLRQLLVDRKPLPYGRFRHWWEKDVPQVEVRILGV